MGRVVCKDCGSTHTRFDECPGAFIRTRPDDHEDRAVVTYDLSWRDKIKADHDERERIASESVLLERRDETFRRLERILNRMRGQK